MNRKNEILKIYKTQLDDITEQGLLKNENPIISKQGAVVTIKDGRQLINMCANNYLGLSADQRLIDTAKKSYDTHGYGLASVRFICGTQDLHKELEFRISKFLQTEDTILYSSCYDANGGLFESILSDKDAVISDELNHASIIDGVRLCKAKRYRYKNNNMADLRKQLEDADKNGARIKLIATDGVFSMDGIIADLKSICDLADEFNALVMVDDSHASGFIGENGKGSIEHCGVLGRVDIVTSTLGKALGGASGGFTSARKEIVDILRQKSRPYLFSNTLAPAITGASIEVINILENDNSLVGKLAETTMYYRQEMKKAGFDIIDGVHPIVPVMIYDEKKANEIATKMFKKGVYVVAFSYPVVPKGKSRIRTQVSALHEKSDIDFIVKCFKECIE